MTLTLFFYEISEYVNFFCLKMFLSQKKPVSEHQFRENEVACKCCHEKVWGFSTCFCCSYNHLKVKIVMYTFQTRLHWKPGFSIPILVISYFQILCSNIDFAKKPITWMTIIRVAKSSLW